MKIAFAVVILSISLYNILADDCHCWSNYAREETNGKVACHSTLTLDIVPCNIPEVPTCQCEKAVVNGIMTDRHGRWCMGAGGYWPCENAEEWNNYEQTCKNELYCIPNSQGKDSSKLHH